MPQIYTQNAVLFAVYTKKDMTSYSNAEAAEHLKDPDHLNGNVGSYWSGTHPFFNTGHGFPFTAVVDVKNGEVINTDPIPQLLTPQEVLDAVIQANSD